LESSAPDLTPAESSAVAEPEPATTDLAELDRLAASNGHAEPPLLPTVLTPGPHVTDTGEYVEQSAAAFCEHALAALPLGTLYRRGGVPGELLGAPGERSFVPVGRERIRLLLEQRVRLVRWVKKKKKSAKAEDRHVQVYQNCTPDQGALLVAAAGGLAPEIATLARYPTILHDPHWRVSPPGLTGTHYYDEPPSLEPFDLPSVHDQGARDNLARLCRELIDDALVDFPFATPADKANFIGLLLTPILRPTIHGPVPLHLITAPQAGVGKTLLVERVLGLMVLGQRTPATQIGDNEEERDKRITSLLLAGQNVIHLDNLNDLIDSAVLASLLTADTYQGRILGSSRSVALPNRSILVATGNSVSASTEMARRIVPITLVPSEEHPENRTGFQHPRLDDYIASARQDFLNALLCGITMRYDFPDRLARYPVLGSFESWTQAVSPVLHALGYVEHLRNLTPWRETADSDGSDLHELVTLWWDRWGDTPVPASELAGMARDAGLFASLFGYAKTPKSADTTFALRVLRRSKGRVVAGHRIVWREARKGNLYTLAEPLEVGPAVGPAA